MAERLDEALAGSPLAAVTPLQFSALRTVTPSPETLAGRVLSLVARRGKYLILDLSGPRIVVHLSQGGRVDLEDPPRSSRPRGGVVRFSFEGRPSVLVKEFGTQRKAGWWALSPGDDGPLAGLGPEPWSDAFQELVLRGHDRRRIHTILRDQRTVAGIGRGYADDVLHEARVSPFATLASLSPPQREALLRAVQGVLSRGLDQERERRGGLPARLGDAFAVHGRHGTACPRCGQDLRRVSYESHEVTYCPACQTGGRVLADRRLSRLVR